MRLHFLKTLSHFLYVRDIIFTLFEFFFIFIKDSHVLFFFFLVYSFETEAFEKIYLVWTSSCMLKSIPLKVHIPLQIDHYFILSYLVTFNSLENYKVVTSYRRQRRIQFYDHRESWLLIKNKCFFFMLKDLNLAECSKYSNLLTQHVKTTFFFVVLHWGDSSPFTFLLNFKEQKDLTRFYF